MPWHRLWFVAGGHAVRAVDVPDVLGPVRFSALVGAWRSWDATGVRPPTPDGVDEVYMTVQEGHGVL